MMRPATPELQKSLRRGLRLLHPVRRAPALAGMALIRLYQVSLSGLLGRQCRYLPSCSAYAMEAVERHGLWAGGWMGFARICRCHPWGGHGLDFPPRQRPPGASWLRPWRYGLWRGQRTRPEGRSGSPMRCEDAS